MIRSFASTSPFVALFAAAAVVAQDAPKTAQKLAPPDAIQAIAEKELLGHANFLASDELGGRLTGSKGQQAAAKYIANHFESLGLAPLGDRVEGGDAGDAGDAGVRSYYQRYGIERTYVVDGASVVVGEVRLDEGFAVLGAKEMAAEIAGKAAWVGYGRTRGASRDIPEDGDLSGKVAVVAVKGPRGRVRDDLSVEQKFGMSFGVLGGLGRTARNLAKVGAEAVLFVQWEDKVGLADVLNYVALSPGKAMVTPNFPGADRSMSMMGRMVRSGGVPTLVLSTGASRRVLAQLGVDEEAFRAFVEDGDEAPVGEEGVECSVGIAVKHEEDASASNVCAVLRGSDPELRAEAIVYSAHMDHVGKRMDGDVFNGADDNASGSAGLLAIASAYAKADRRPRRSVIFLSVSGEELGLWGSQYYSDHSTWQLDKLVANINTDMIGRSGPESGPMQVTVTPSYRHPKFSTIVRDSAAFAESMGVTFSSGDKYYARSDHYNFAKKGIPVVFFCNGEHEDYHQVTDHAEKLDGAKMERIARLAFWTGWHVANADERPKGLGRQKGW
ncbi:MAG: M20/M25/M40 family metallo-hydrolase [Planctomycetota bacterium]|nr:M20/M25/M40 family metallo-hydrolase [Planctomycetota bacterium]